MRRLTLAVLIVAAACSAAEERAAEPSASTTPSAPDTVTLDEFRQIHWIAGTWRGSGGAYPSFFEEYRIVDDSTIQMRALPDSTFAVATDSSSIEWRGGWFTRGATIADT